MKWRCVWALVGVWFNASLASAQPLLLAMANPAAVACASAGGISMKTYDSKGEHSMCQLPSGQVCEEWAFFKGECPSSDSAPSTPPAKPAAPNTASDNPLGSGSN
ncbi:MAG: DUF333 domain-containing protein [Betaproteobacteria bacterium]|jgi:putative hemolysin|nr:DUF333 domain-containing protein [Betaproteobacteria bacterium]